MKIVLKFIKLGRKLLGGFPNILFPMGILNITCLRDLRNRS